MSLTPPLLASRAGLIGVVMMLVLCGGLVACDRHGAQHRRMQKLLDHAIQTIDQAELGYVPADDPVGVAIEVKPLDETESLAEYQLKTLDNAITDLEAVAARGADHQRAVAYQLLATIHTTCAVHGRVRADDAESRLLSERDDLSSQLNTLMFETTRSTDVVAVQNPISAFQQKIDSSEKELAAQTRRANELRASRDESLAAELVERDKSTAARKESARLGEQVALAEGEARANLVEQQQAASREASAAAILADGFKQQADHIGVEMASVEMQLNALHTSIRLLKEQREEAVKAIALRRTRDQQQQANCAAMLVRQADRYRELRIAYDEQVRLQRNKALSRLDLAIASREEAAPLAGSPTSRSVLLQAVADRVEQVKIMTRHIAALRGFAGQVDVFLTVADRVDVDASAFEQERNSLTEEHHAVIAAIEHTIDEAHRISQMLDGGDEAAALLNQLDRLTGTIRVD